MWRKSWADIGDVLVLYPPKKCCNKEKVEGSNSTKILRCAGQSIKLTMKNMMSDNPNFFF